MVYSVPRFTTYNNEFIPVGSWTVLIVLTRRNNLFKIVNANINLTKIDNGITVE